MIKPTAKREKGPWLVPGSNLSESESNREMAWHGLMKRRRLKRKKLCSVENVVSKAIFGCRPAGIFTFAGFWWEECRCSLLLCVLQMNMTGLIHWCEGWTRCPLLSSCQSGYCLSHSLTPWCHQLARAQVSLRHRGCCLPPSVTSLIISLRWVRYLTHRDVEENSAHTARRHRDINTGHARWNKSECTLVESDHCQTRAL